MHDIEMQEMTKDFFPIWQAAGMHLDGQVQGGIQSWLRAHPYPPVLEHLSFRLGNQLFFVRVEDEEQNILGPGSKRGLLMIADACHGHPCILPMKKKFFGGKWVASERGWGLLDARSGRPINPIDLVSDEKIEMSEWELQDFAVQVVKNQLEKSGYQIMSWQANPEVDPSVWFVGESKGPEWVVVRPVRYPEKDAKRPSNWDQISQSCSHMSNVGHFASVAVASMDDPFDPTGENAVPLYRGHGMHVRYEGLQS